jgi:hypothetical protein
MRMMKSSDNELAACPSYSSNGIADSSSPAFNNIKVRRKSDSRWSRKRIILKESDLVNDLFDSSVSKPLDDSVSAVNENEIAVWNVGVKKIKNKGDFKRFRDDQSSSVWNFVFVIFSV